MRHLADISEVLHAERVFLLPQELVDALVEALGVQAIDFGRIHAQGAVHEDGHARQLPRQRQLVQGIDDLLRAADGEGRDDDLAFALEGFAHHLAHLGVGVGFWRMLARAVGALDLQVIHVLHRLRVAQDVVVAPPDVAAEEVAELAPVLADIQNHLRRPQDVPGVAEGDRDAVGDRKRAVVVDADKLPDRLVGVRGGVERLDRRQAVLGALLRDEGGVIALDFGRVLQHDAGQVARGEGAVDVALETLAAKVGQVAAVVNMRVAEDDRIDLLRVEGEVAVALDGFAPPALKQAALQQQPLPVQLEEINRSGGRAGRAEEMNSHGGEIVCRLVKSSKVRRACSLGQGVAGNQQGGSPASRGR